MSLESETERRPEQTQPADPFMARRQARWREQERTVRVAGHEFRVLVPSRSDPRVVEIAALALAMFFRIVIVHQPLTALQIITALVTPVVLDIVLTYIRRRIVVTPASGLITGLLAALILQSDQVWPYAAVGVVAMLGKHFIWTRERHIFNPSAFGLFVILLAFPGVAHASLEHWQSNPAASPIIVIGGVLASWRARMLTVTEEFIPTYAILTIVTSVLSRAIHGGVHSFLQAFDVAKVNVLAAHDSFAIMALYLITDPRTAPKAYKGKQIYAVFTGVLAVALYLIGVDRVLALLGALLVANLLAVFVIDRIFPVEDEGPKKKLPPPIEKLRAAALDRFQGSPGAAAGQE